MFETIRIKNLTEIFGRWHWDVVVENYDGDGPDSVRHYYTNKNGEGIYTDNGQVTGNTQFSLNGVSRSTMYRRIRTYFSD